MSEVIEEKAYDESAWDGSASNYSTPEAYCSACLIDMNEPGQKKTKDKCKLPYKKEGSSAINKNALRAMASGARGLSATNAPADMKKKAARWIASHWQSAFGKPAPESIMGMAGMHKNKALFYKDTSGKIWFFGIYSNNFEDREKEILSWEGHLEYSTWVKESGYRPPIVLYHQPKMPDIVYLALFRALERGLLTTQEYNAKINQIYKDFTIAHTKSIIPVNGFTLVIGEVPEEKYPVVTRMMESDLEWGMSHGFVALEVNDNIINKYRSFELTVLPLEKAANELTMSLMIGEKGMAELKGLTEEDRKELDTLLGADTAEKVEETTSKAQELLSGILASKQEPPPTKDEEEKQEDEEEAVEEKAVDPYITFRDRLVKELGFEELQQGWKTLVDTIQALRTELDTLKKDTKTALKATEDEIIARQYYHWTPPSFKEEEKPEDAALLKQLKESAQAGITAKDKVTPDVNDPMYTGFWGPLLKGQ